MKAYYLIEMGFVALMAYAAPSSANCAMGPTYDINVRDNTVMICAYGEGMCPYTSALLRQNVKTGETVELHAFCAEICYLDECVPPGTYRYGFAQPFDCHPGACGPTEFYGEAEVDQDSTSCELSEGNQGTVAYELDVPWKDSSDGLVCDPGTGCVHAGSGAPTVFFFNIGIMILACCLRARRHRR